MKSDRNIEEEIEARSRRAVEQNEWLSLVRGSPDIESTEDYGDFEFYADELVKNGKASLATTLFTAKRRLREFLAEHYPETSPTEIGTNHAVDFINYIDQEYKSSTTSMYRCALNKMAQFYTSHDYYEGNPFSDTQLNEDRSRNVGILSSKRVKVSDKKLREAIKGQIDINLVIVAILVKTGMRRSELVNLRKKDVYIDHHIADELLAEPRSEIQDKPDSIFVSSQPSRSKNEAGSDVFGNKRKCDSVIPIDGELKQILVWYLSISPINPNTDSFLLKRDGTKFGSEDITDRIKRWAKKQDLPEGNDDELDNVTPHWFRSKFTTEIYTNIDPNDIEFGRERFVKGVRGDVGTDVIDEYLMKYEKHRGPFVEAMFDIGLSVDI